MNKQVLLALLFGHLGVKADQPVHCLRESVYGLWQFHVSKDTANVNLFDAKEVCTHQLSNKVQMISKEHQFSFADEDVWEVNLMDNNLVEASVNGGDVQKGTWSTVYDQSMLVQLESGL